MSGSRHILSLAAVAALTALLAMVLFAQAATVTVGPGSQHQEIQAAIEAASPGWTIIVEPGEYRENLVVDKSLSIRGAVGAGARPVVDGGGQGPAVTIVADGVILEGLQVTNSSESGVVVSSSNNTISALASTNNGYCGIRVEGGRNNTISGNDASINGAVGIELEESDHNWIHSNRAAKNADTGIELEDSSGNRVENNTVIGNGNDGIELKSSSNNTLSFNLAMENKDGLCLEDRSDENLLQGNNASYNEVSGLLIRDSAGAVLEDNEMSGNREGITLEASSNGTVRNNTAIRNLSGIRLNYYSWNNLLYRNRLVENANYDARDESGKNQWDDGSIGNYYSSFDQPVEGCTGSGGLCQSAYGIPGGSSLDRYPQIQRGV